MTSETFELTEEGAVNMLLALGDRLGTFLSTLPHRVRLVAVEKLHEALNLPESVYVELLFRPKNVLIRELDEADVPTFIANSEGETFIANSEGEIIIDPEHFKPPLDL